MNFDDEFLPGYATTPPKNTNKKKVISNRSRLELFCGKTII